MKEFLKHLGMFLIVYVSIILCAMALAFFAIGLTMFFDKTTHAENPRIDSAPPESKLYLSPIYNEVSISSLLSDGDKYDGQRVAIHAIMGTTQGVLSRRGQPIFIYYLHPSLEDKDLRMVKVLSYGKIAHTSLGTKIIVLGTFHVSGHFGGLTFSNFVEPDYLQPE